MRVILSTRNPSKAEQIKAVFSGLPISILTLSETGIEGEAVEDGQTLRENALKKARFARKFSPADAWCMAEDTGLFINALSGAPGIKAARWAGENASTSEITAHTLKLLKGKSDRSGTFEAVVVLISPSGQEYFFAGKVGGRFLNSPRVPSQPQMPYSGIFIPEGENQVWAEMSVERENSISHRGQAFRQARSFLEKLVGQPVAN